jgi:predicted ribosomally synthesized peptide with SipW-like signal peptide
MKQTLTSLLIIGLVALTAGAGTYALFSDTETSTGNTFTAGILDLFMLDGGPDISHQWILSNMVPGDTTPGVGYETDQVNLYNIGTIDADHAEIFFDVTETDPAFVAGNNEESDTLDGAAGMSEHLRVDSITYSYSAGSPVIAIVWNNGATWDPAYIADTNGNLIIDVQDLDQTTFDNLPAPPMCVSPPAGPNYQFSMAVQCLGSMSNDYQGDEVTITIDFTLNQDASQ